MKKTTEKNSPTTARVSQAEKSKSTQRKNHHKKISKPFFEKQEWNKKYRTLKKQKTKQLFCWPNDDSNLFDIYNTRFRKKKIPDQYFSMIAVYFSIKVFEKINWKLSPRTFCW